jgi:hypothetical protein
VAASYKAAIQRGADTARGGNTGRMEMTTWSLGMERSFPAFPSFPFSSGGFGIFFSIWFFSVILFTLVPVERMILVYIRRGPPLGGRNQAQAFSTSFKFPQLRRDSSVHHYAFRERQCPQLCRGLKTHNVILRFRDWLVARILLRTHYMFIISFSKWPVTAVPGTLGQAGNFWPLF